MCGVGLIFKTISNDGSTQSRNRSRWSMTTLSLPQFVDGHRLTHSSESTFKSCPRKFFYRYRLGLTPANNSDALRLGSAFHIGLEALKGGKSIEDAVLEVFHAYAEQVCPPWLTQEEYATERETAIALVRGWHHQYGGDFICEYIAVEQSFELPIINPETNGITPKYKSAGKIDGIVKLPDGRIAIIEHKTTSEAIDSGADYWDKLTFDSQISRYYLAARNLGYDISTVIYDVVRKPGISPRNITKAARAQATADGHYFGVKLTATCPEHETPQMYGARLLADLKERPEFYFARNEITRIQADLDDFAWEQWAIMKQISESDRFGRWYRNTNSCNQWNKRCEYMDLCAGKCADPQEQTPAGFVVKYVLHPELAETTTGATV